MSMYFSTMPSHILFEWWYPTSGMGIAASCFVIFIMAGLSTLMRAYLHHPYLMNADLVSTIWESIHPVAKSRKDKKESREPLLSNRSQKPGLTLIAGVLNLCLTGGFITLGYLAMLIAMTFNVYYFISVLLGLIIGTELGKFLVHTPNRNTARVDLGVVDCCE